VLSIHIMTMIPANVANSKLDKLTIQIANPAPTTVFIVRYPIPVIRITFPLFTLLIVTFFYGFIASSISILSKITVITSSLSYYIQRYFYFRTEQFHLSFIR